jgi:SAM-dependent methyltransferase
VRGSADSLPFRAATIDLCFLGEVVEHVYRNDVLFDEVYRVLRPGGRVVITTPNLAAWFNRIALLFGYAPISYCSERGNRWGVPRGVDRLDGRLDHVRLFTRRGLAECLLHHGFREIRTRGISQPGLYGSAFLRSVARFAPADFRDVLLLTAQRPYL